MKKKYRGIDLFCGIGGFRLAMNTNNVDCVFSSDIDRFAQQTYEANFSEVPTGDITQVDAKDIPSFDILTAGFPCQPFSYAGAKAGFKDKTRGTLFFDICRILEHHKPPMVFLENVKGLVSHEKGKTLATVLDYLRELGYFPHYKVLSSLDYGLPQKRERWYCVAFREDIDFEFPEKLECHPTLRDIVDDIRSKTSYLGRLLSEVSKSYDPTDLRNIEQQLENLNNNAIDKSSILAKIQESLKGLDSALDRQDSKVSITPFAKRIMDLNKSVSIHYGTPQDSFTMDYHGMGTRSWSSLLTFKAFLQNQETLQTEDEVIFPIIAVEEPEAHLHPNAQKMLYSQITTMPGQKIISTHSPYIVASSNLSEIRGMYKDKSKVEIGSFPTKELDLESIRKIRQTVIKSKGELVFSRAIILVEGETEEQALPIMAEKYFGCSQSDLAIDFVGVGGSGNRYIPFIQLAKYLRIPWFVFSDGEPKAIKELDKVIEKIYPQKTSKDFCDNIFIIPEGKDFEGMLLMDSGYKELIEKTIGEIKGKDNFVKDQIAKLNGKSSGKRIPTKEKCDKCNQFIFEEKYYDYNGVEGYSKALDDILSNMKTEFAPTFAIKMADSDLAIPPLVEDLFKKIKEQIYHE